MSPAGFEPAIPAKERPRPTPKGAHTRTSLASESGWARVQMSQTRPCVERHKPDFGRLYIYIRAWLPSQAPRGGLASQTST
jgi:hypothetical protein